MKNLQREHLKKLFKKIHEKLDRVSILVAKTDWGFAAAWCPFRALGRPGAKLVPEPPPRAPGMVPDPIFNDFCSFWINFWLLFAFAHLSAITFFAVVFGFLFG